MSWLTKEIPRRKFLKGLSFFSQNSRTEFDAAFFGARLSKRIFDYFDAKY